MGFRFEYTGIRVRDLDNSLAFYRDTLGLKLTYRGASGPGEPEVAVLECPGSGQRLELTSYTAGGKFAAPYREGDELDHLAFVVDDVIRAVEDLRRQGVPIKVEPQGNGRVPSAYVLDPDGIWVELRPGSPSRPGGQAERPGR